MIARLAWRLLREPSWRLGWHLARTTLWHGGRRLRRWRREPEDRRMPPFLFISVTDRCNLRCRGCWVGGGDGARTLSLQTLDRVVTEARAAGNRFFGLLGGEPLLHDGLLELCERHRDCAFQIFTNGTLLTRPVAARMRRCGNVTPLVSIEGRAESTAERRGSAGVYQDALQALAHCRAERLVTGVATSVCQGNRAEVAADDFVAEMIRRGVHYLWYYIYRPVGPAPHPEEALDRPEIRALRRWLVAIRRRAPLLVLDTYWDETGQALCPAATGVSHHLGPGGDLEPCPPIQFARDRLEAARPVGEVLADSTFLRDFRRLARETTPGCILLADPAALARFVAGQQARDTSGRGTGAAELAAMTPRPCHHDPEETLPEAHWLYRLGKRHWFGGLAAYG
jgi:MoaA/NifB/PqqE/SkfB family radical SAM enzyme